MTETPFAAAAAAALTHEPATGDIAARDPVALAAAQTLGPGDATGLTSVRRRRGTSPPASGHGDRVNTERGREVRA